VKCGSRKAEFKCDKKPTIYERAIGSEPKFGVQILDGLGCLRYY
jgi:hypothetical protein